MDERLKAGTIDNSEARPFTFDFGKGREFGRVAGGTLAKITLAEDRPHFHEGFDETYIFLRGYGTMRLQDQVVNVSPGDVVNIPRGSVHGLLPSNDERNIGVNSYSLFCIASPEYDPKDIHYVD